MSEPFESQNDCLNNNYHINYCNEIVGLGFSSKRTSIPIKLYNLLECLGERHEDVNLLFKTIFSFIDFYV